MPFFRPTVKKTILMNALNLYSCSDDRIKTGKKAIAHPLWEFDVVQPRFDMSLERVIRILQQTNQPYSRIHSNFCRESIHAVIRRKYDPSEEESPHAYQGDLGRWHIL